VIPRRISIQAALPFATAIELMSVTSVGPGSSTSNPSLTWDTPARVFGTTVNATVAGGGEQDIEGAARQPHTIDSGGVQLVSSGGTAFATTDNGIQFVFCRRHDSTDVDRQRRYAGGTRTAISATVIGTQYVDGKPA